MTQFRIGHETHSSPFPQYYISPLQEHLFIYRIYQLTQNEAFSDGLLAGVPSAGLRRQGAQVRHRHFPRWDSLWSHPAGEGVAGGCCTLSISYFIFFIALLTTRLQGGVITHEYRKFRFQPLKLTYSRG